MSPLQKAFLCALCGFIFLPQSPQSRRKGHQGISVFITHLIPYFNKVTLVFFVCFIQFFINFLEPILYFFASWRLGVQYFIFLLFSK